MTSQFVLPLARSQRDPQTPPSARIAETRKLLLRAEIEAERTVALVRMIVGVATLLLFFGIVAPQRSVSDPIHREIPYIMAYALGFIAVGVVSFVIARKGRYRPWMTWLFNTSDLVFWLVLMASAVFNYSVPAGYFVAAPPTVVILALLALASLRNNPWLAAYSTAFVAIALIGLAAVAPDGPGQSPALTGADPMFFQVPLNLIRISVLVLGGLTMVYLTTRTRALLRRAIDQTLQRRHLSRYLPPQVGDRIARFDEDRLRRGAEQDAAVMFVDIRGFTEMAEGMDPADLGGFLGEFRTVVAAEVNAHHGIVDKFIGDSVMAVFGALESHGNDAANAVDCSVAILAALAKWNRARQHESKPPVAVGIGAHWGRVFCGAIGDENRLEFTVLGDTVNIASRLETLTRETSYDVLLSHQLLVEQARRDGSGWEELPEHIIRGHSGRIRLYGRRSSV